MITRTARDKEKASVLISMSRTTLERLKQTDKEKYPSNTLTDYYEIIRKLMEALNILDGIKVKGEGAHIEIINLVCKDYNFPESDREFLQQLRDYRNRIAYEGFYVNADYIKLNSKRIEKMIATLIRISEKKL